MRKLALLLSVVMLAACDQLTGAAAQKTSDAEAVGYACRVSLKSPEDCMKENDVHSPTSVLDGWKSADQDIREGKLDPSMGAKKEAPVAEETKPEAEKSDKPDDKSVNVDKSKEDKPKAEAKPAEDKAKH